jgi:hypothetical protein
MPVQAGPAWLDALDPLFATISTSFLQKAIRDFGKTGFYDSDGYFSDSVAPWLEADVASTAGAGSASELLKATPTVPPLPTLVLAFEADAPAREATSRKSDSSNEKHGTSDIKRNTASARQLVVCEYGPKIAHHYISNYATDRGKLYPTLAAAKAACSADIRCGGALSRSCNENNTVCQYVSSSSFGSPFCKQMLARVIHY